MKNVQEVINPQTIKARSKFLFKNVLYHKRELLLLVLFLVCVLLIEVFVFNKDYIIIRWGGLEERHYKIKDGVLFDFKKQQGALLALSNDPNVTLNNINIRVAMVLLDNCKNTLDGSFGQIFYRTTNEAFDELRSISYPTNVNKNQKFLHLPSTVFITSLRLDLTNLKGDLVQCREIVINPSLAFKVSLPRIGIYLLLLLFVVIYIFRKTVSPLVQKIDYHVVGNILASAWFVLLGIHALTTFDKSFDSMVYHIPFAARSVGIFPKSGYLFEDNLEYVYKGFPILIEFLQGLLWKISGWVTATNLVSLLFLLLLISVASKRLGIPFWQLSFFLLSVPLILIHSTSSDNDLAIASLFSIAFVNLLYAILNDDYSYKSLIFILLPLAIGTNAKFTMVSPAAILTVITLILFSIKLSSQREDRQAFQKQLIGYLVIISAILIVGSITLIKNMWMYQNPLYPLDFSFWFIKFKGPFAPKISSVANPLVNIKDFLLSLSEVYLWKTSTDFLWTVDMYNIYQGNPIRHGGFFIANIVSWWLCIVFLLRANKDSKQRLIGLIVLLVWILVGFLPASFELRYSMYLPIILAIAALLFLRKYHQERKRDLIFYNFVHALQVSFFIFVVFNTFHYIYPTRDFENINTATYGFQDKQYQLLNAKTPVCLPGKIPFTFLYKLENPQLDLQAAYSQEACIYPPLK